MTVSELTDKLLRDGANHPKKRVRRRCTAARCRRVAETALAMRGQTYEHILERCAMDDDDLPDDAADQASDLMEEGFGNPFLFLLAPFIQIALKLLVQWAINHISAE